MQDKHCRAEQSEGSVETDKGRDRTMQMGPGKLGGRGHSLETAFELGCIKQSTCTRECKKTYTIFKKKAGAGVLGGSCRPQLGNGSENMSNCQTSEVSTNCPLLASCMSVYSSSEKAVPSASKQSILEFNNWTCFVPLALILQSLFLSSCTS